MNARIVAIGNCQVRGLSACLKAMCPGIEVDHFFLRDLKSLEHSEEVAEQLAGYDLVLAHRDVNPASGALRTEMLQQKVKRLSLIPKLGFSGFHPDTMMMMDPALRPAPLGSYHSALVAGAYVAGAPREQVADLFNAYIYARLGYFDEYAKARAFLSTQMTRLGFEADSLFDAWEAIGQFMYTPNHPRIEVIWAFAEAICRRDGLAAGGGRDLPADELSENVHWPVYPEIGRRFGVDGSLVFTPQKQPALDLDAYIDAVWRLYRRLPVEKLHDRRILQVADVLREEGIGRPGGPGDE